MSAKLGVLPLLIEITALTVQPPAYMSLASFLAYDPGAVDPWWPVTHMLMMATVEFGDPMALIVSMKRKNFSLHNADLILPWCTWQPDVPVQLLANAWHGCKTPYVQLELGPRQFQSKV